MKKGRGSPTARDDIRCCNKQLPEQVSQRVPDVRQPVDDVLQPLGVQVREAVPLELVEGRRGLFQHAQPPRGDARRDVPAVGGVALAAEELAVPVDRPVQFTLTSTSVMNAFYIPAMAGMIETATYPVVITNTGVHFSLEGPLLELTDVRTHFTTARGLVRAAAPDSRYALKDR